MEADKQTEQIVPGLGRDGWHVRKHPKPLSDPTFIITPNTCAGWGDEKVRRLGGTEAIRTAMGLSAELVEMLRPNEEKMVLVHAEASNEAVIDCHIKWHVLNLNNTVDVSKMQQMERFASERPHIVFQTGEITAALGGAYDGQILLYSIEGRLYSEAAPEIAEALDRVAKLYEAKFLSADGLAPDFSVLVSIGAENQFRFASITPTLRHLGAMERTIGITIGAEMSLGCTLKTMHKYLTEE